MPKHRESKQGGSLTLKIVVNVKDNVSASTTSNFTNCKH